jgi:hypothetical protein
VIADGHNVCGEGRTGNREKTRYEEFHSGTSPILRTCAMFRTL